eukprot:2541084-Pleurochrysis_carterae.AAC.2
MQQGSAFYTARPRRLVQVCVCAACRVVPDRRRALAARHLRAQLRRADAGAVHPPTLPRRRLRRVTVAA